MPLIHNKNVQNTFCTPKKIITVQNRAHGFFRFSTLCDKYSSGERWSQQDGANSDPCTVNDGTTHEVVCITAVIQTATVYNIQKTVVASKLQLQKETATVHHSWPYYLWRRQVPKTLFSTA